MVTPDTAAASTGEPEGAPAAVVGPYLAGVLDDPRWRDCRIGLIAGGRSNLTYRVDSPAGSVVLRRPPLSGVLPTAHDMVREHRVVAALGPTAVPVPAALHLCTDTEVVGAPFWVSEYVAGPVVRGTLPPGYADRPEQRRAIAEKLVDVLAALHAVDPSAVGLADFGRPEGFVTRQVARWTRQWKTTAQIAAERLGGVETVAEPTEAADLDALADRLAGSVPAAAATRRPGVVHGDYRLDNTVLDPDGSGRVVAVLDWEMSTLGDPLTDLGLLLVYWNEAADTAGRRASLPVSSVTALEGFPGRREVVERYAAATGADLDDLPWYVGMAAFKLAVVVVGVIARQRAGAMLFDQAGEQGQEVAGQLRAALAPLLALGHSALDGDAGI
jgi:aminoglycoside phosphotransferase (APT) family kinase protein